jgi:macrodomain Ter protein organizer (MatP/YcbG family)
MPRPSRELRQKSIGLEPAQWRWLAREAKRRKIVLAEMVRRIIRWAETAGLDPER